MVEKYGLQGGGIMEIKKNFNLRKIAGEYILMPKNTSEKGYNGLISLNEVEALVWKNLTNKNLNTVYVYYKIVTDGNCYLGGITYRAKFENVKGEKSVTADTLHFSNKNSEIIKIEQFSTK